MSEAWGGSKKPSPSAAHSNLGFGTVSNGAQNVSSLKSERDPLARMLSTKINVKAPPAAERSRRVTQQKRLAWRAEKSLRNLQKGLQHLNAGGGVPAPAQPDPPRQDVEADVAELARLRKLCVDFHIQNPGASQASVGEKRGAFKRLTRAGPGYGGPVRGDVEALRMENLSLPPVCEGGFPVQDAFPWVKNWEGEMLLQENVAPSLEQLRETPSYCDPQLRAGTVALTELTVHLFERGLVRPVQRRGQVGCQMFTLHKKLGEQRLIFDMRRPGRMFRPPPPVVMGSPRALSFLDLSSGSIGEDGVWAFAGDVPVFFYHLMMPASWAQYNWLQGVDFQGARDACVAKGADPSLFEGCDGFGFVALPMGHPWAPFLAQGCLEHVLSLAGVAKENFLLHGRAASALERDSVIALPYLDDFLGIVRASTPPQACIRAEHQLEHTKRKLGDCGLGCHKEATGKRLTSLGMVLDLDERTVCPVSEKFVPLLHATRYVLEKRSASPHQIAKLLGHWTWWLSLRPELYSILETVYVFCKRCANWDVPLTLGSDVLTEFRTLMRLAPFVRADLGWEFSPRLYASDACLSGGGVTYAHPDPSNLRALFGKSCSWTGATEASAELAEVCAQGGWKVAIATPWKRPDGRIDALEGEAAILAMRHRMRDRSSRQVRFVQLQDNQATLGSFRKGRSSAPRLLRQCRRAAALALFGQWKIAWVYVPSAWNPADEPSRRWEQQAPRMRPAEHLAMLAQGSAMACPAPPSQPPPRTSSGSANAPSACTALPGAQSWRFIAADPEPRLLSPCAASPVAAQPQPVRGKELRIARLRLDSDRFSWSLPGCLPSPLDGIARGLRNAVALTSDEIYRKRHQQLAHWATRRQWNPQPGGPELYDKLLCGLFAEIGSGREPGGRAAPGQILSAVLHAYPGWSGSLPLAARYVRRVVPRVQPGVERKGIPWAVALSLACRARRRGWLETSLKTLLKFDALLRMEDLDSLRVRDVQLCQRKVVLRLGTQLDRPVLGGQTLLGTKTGYDQGVIIERDFIAQELLQLVRGRCGREYAFRQTRAQFELEFRELTSGAGLSVVPHQLRHGGASDMVLRGQPLWAVLRRGRWLCMKSVQRYAKPWAVLVAWSSLPPDIAREAEEVTALGDSEAWNSAAHSVARRLAF